VIFWQILDFDDLSIYTYYYNITIMQTTVENEDVLIDFMLADLLQLHMYAREITRISDNV